MRNLLALIIIAAAGYYFYTKYPDKVAQYIPALAKATPAADPAAPGADGQPAAPGMLPPESSALPIPRAVATPPPFVSKISAEDSAAATMPPGVFLVLGRASVETDSGVTAISPGDRVSLLERKPNGRMRVTDGKLEYTIDASQLTQDVEQAKAAEKAEWERRYGVAR